MSEAGGNVILIVDDDEGCRRALGRILGAGGYETAGESTIAGAEARLAKGSVTCLLTEFRLPDGDGVDLLDSMIHEYPYTGRVVLTGVVDFAAVQDAVNRGSVHAFFTKPWDNQALLQGIAAVIEKCRLERVNHEIVRRLEMQNEVLEKEVRRRTAQLETAKRELEAVFDAQEDPLSITNSEYEVVRANLAYARACGLDIRQVPGTVCHDVMFGSAMPCAGCPVVKAIEAGNRVDGRAADGRRVMATPIDVGRKPATLLVRYFD